MKDLVAFINYGINLVSSDSYPINGVTGKENSEGFKSKTMIPQGFNYKNECPQDQLQ